MVSYFYENLTLRNCLIFSLILTLNFPHVKNRNLLNYINGKPVLLSYGGRFSRSPRLKKMCGDATLSHLFGASAGVTLRWF